jgi:hypothetical protein
MAEGDQPPEKPSMLQGMDQVIWGVLGLLGSYGYTIYQYVSDKNDYVYAGYETAGSTAFLRFIVFTAIWGAFIWWKWPREGSEKDRGA